MAFCDQLAKLRKRKKITQIELAKKLGVKQYVVSSWETGRSEPCISQIIELSDILDIPTDYLLDKKIIRVNSEDDFTKVIKNINEDADDDFINCIKKLCNDMSEERKEKITNVIKEIKNF